MSFRPATKDLHQTTQLTSLYLIGGYDASPDIGTSTLNVDLRVAGGALIKKNIVVVGNVYSQNILANITSESIYVSRITEKHHGQEIKVNGNLVLINDHWIKSNVGYINSFLTETISEKFPLQGISVVGDTTFDNQITAPTINATAVLNTNAIASTGTLTITAPTLIQLNTSTLDVASADIINVNQVFAASAAPIEFFMDSGMYLTVETGSGIDLTGKDLINANLITATTLRNDANTTLTITSNTNVNIYSGIGITLRAEEDIVIDPINGSTLINSDLIIVGNMISFEGKDVNLMSNLDMVGHDINNVDVIRANVLQTNQQRTE